MAVHLHSFNNSDGNLWDKPKQALSDSTNIHLKDCSISSLIDQYSGQTYCRTKITNEKLTSNKIDQLVDKQSQIEQRAMYNARQTLLIPFIMDIDFSSLVESSSLSFEPENHLLINILTLLKKSNDECSFYEQFKI